MWTIRDSQLTTRERFGIRRRHARKLLFSSLNFSQSSRMHTVVGLSTTPITWVWRSIRQLRTDSVNCVFWPLWEKIRAFYYLSREIFHLWTDRQEMNVELSQKLTEEYRLKSQRSSDIWMRSNKKKFRNFSHTDWEIFGVKGKIFEGEYLAQGWRYRDGTSVFAR